MRITESDTLVIRPDRPISDVGYTAIGYGVRGKYPRGTLWIQLHPAYAPASWLLGASGCFELPICGVL
jgi:hypothetical protein